MSLRYLNIQSRNTICATISRKLFYWFFDRLVEMIIGLLLRILLLILQCFFLFSSLLDLSFLNISIYWSIIPILRTLCLYLLPESTPIIHISELALITYRFSFVHKSSFLVWITQIQEHHFLRIQSKQIIYKIYTYV